MVSSKNQLAINMALMMYITAPVFYGMFAAYFAVKIKDLYPDSKKLKAVASFL